MSERKLLLISNSSQHGQGYLDHCADEIADILTEIESLVFVPFAIGDMDGYASTVQNRFQQLGKSVKSLHTAPSIEDKKALVEEAKAIFIGGGNTFRLLTELYKADVMDVIRRRVLSGELVYLGSSAGSNVAGPTIKTTNDMPIVYPPTFDALQLVPFQINPHYLDPDPQSTHKGETREQRIKEFHELNNAPVLGLREGAYVRISGDTATLKGTTGARLFTQNQEPNEYKEGDSLDFLL